jgi:hypothetical protein
VWQAVNAHSDIMSRTCSSRGPSELALALNLNDLVFCCLNIMMMPTTLAGALRMCTFLPLQGLLLPLILPSGRPSGRRPSLRRAARKVPLLLLLRTFGTKSNTFTLSRPARLKGLPFWLWWLNVPAPGTQVLCRFSST